MSSTAWCRRFPKKKPIPSTRAAPRGGQALRLLDHGELPRCLRHVACYGILFNHESPRRGETFVVRKITRGLARINAGSGAHIDRIGGIADGGVGGRRETIRLSQPPQEGMGVEQQLRHHGQGQGRGCSKAASSSSGRGSRGIKCAQGFPPLATRLR